MTVLDSQTGEARMRTRDSRFFHCGLHSTDGVQRQACGGGSKGEIRNLRILKLRHQGQSITARFVRTKRCRRRGCAPCPRCRPRHHFLGIMMAVSGRPGRISHTHPRRFRGLLGARDFSLRPAEEKLSQRTAQVASDADSRSRKQKQRDQSSHCAVQKHLGSIHQGEPNGFGAPSSLPRTERCEIRVPNPL
jgi:hypothetical protein